MYGVTQVNALKRGGWFLPISPMRSSSTPPMVPISTLASPLSGACYREAPNCRGSSHTRSISGSGTKVNTQVALNSFELSKFALGKTPRLVYVYCTGFQV